MHTDRWTVEVFLFQHDASTTARARLHTTAPGALIGEGTAPRHVGDARMAEITDEIAVGRALVDLGAQLAAVADADTREVREHGPGAAS